MGDAYIMSEKAVGWDWGCPVKHGPTLKAFSGVREVHKGVEVDGCGVKG